MSLSWFSCSNKTQTQGKRGLVTAIMLQTDVRLTLFLLVETLKLLLFSWSCSLMQTCGFPCERSQRRSKKDKAAPFDGKSVLIVSERASILLQSLVRQILQSEVQSLIVVCADVNRFLQQMYLSRQQFSGEKGFPWICGDDNGSDDDVYVRDRRLFFQPIDRFLHKEKVDKFVHNLRQNKRLKLDEVLLLPDDETGGGKDGSSDFPVHYFLQSMLHQNLISPQTGILLASTSIPNLFRLYNHCPLDCNLDCELDDRGEDVRRRVKWMMIRESSRVSVTDVPRLVSGKSAGLSLFLRQWLSFVWRTLFTMSPDYIAGIVTDRMSGGLQTDSSIFIYSKAVK